MYIPIRIRKEKRSLPPRHIFRLFDDVYVLFFELLVHLIYLSRIIYSKCKLKSSPSSRVDIGSFIGMIVHNLFCRKCKPNTWMLKFDIVSRLKNNLSSEYLLIESLHRNKIIGVYTDHINSEFHAGSSYEI